jgi:DNA-binding MarR family transcriptional regulator
MPDSPADSELASPFASRSAPQTARDALEPSLRGCTCFKVRRLARTVSRLYDQHLAVAGLKTTQYSLLRAVALGPAPLARVAGELGVERTTLTRNLKPLLAAGLVDIATGADARERLVALTPLGVAAIARGKVAWRRAQDELQATLGQEFVGGLHRSVDAANANLQGLLTGDHHG